VGPRAGMDAAENRKFLTLPGLELRPLGRPARSQSLYRLRYPDSSVITHTDENDLPIIRSFCANITLKLRRETKWDFHRSSCLAIYKLIYLLVFSPQQDLTHD
jgi:hypothetical protein